MPHEKIKSLRKKLTRKKREVKGKRREKQRSKTRGPKARAKAAKERRIKEGNPKTLREEAAVTKEEAAATSKEAVNLGKEAKVLLASELGVSKSESKSIIQEGGKLLNDLGEQAPELDVDGDGDTDLLQSLEAGFEQRETQQESQIVDPTEPIIDFAGEPEVPEFNAGNKGASATEATNAEIPFGVKPKQTASQTSSMAPSGWRKVVDTSGQVQFEKIEGKGFIVAGKKSTGQWVVVDRTGNSRRNIGSFDKKSAAVDRMQAFMSRSLTDFSLGGGGGEPGTEEQDMLDFQPDLDVDPLG